MTPLTFVLLRGVLFDLDGTLVDSEPYWAAAQTRLVTQFGGHWGERDAKTLTGRAPTTITGRLQSAGVDLEADEIVVRLVDDVVSQLRTEVIWKAGADALLHSVKANGMRTALVTMSPRAIVDVVLEALPAETFDAIVCLDDIRSPKPDPQAYRHALKRLALSAGEAIAIEDSVPGVASAVAAGIATVGVAEFGQFDPHPGVAVWDSLQDVTVTDLRTEHRQSRARVRQSRDALSRTGGSAR